MRGAVLLLAVLMLVAGFGCIEQASYPSVESEQITSSRHTDMDGDGNPDYIIYNFMPIRNEGAGKTLQRQIAVAISTKGTYSSYANITDLDLLMADNSLEDFSDSKNTAEFACSKNLGIQSVNCIDVSTCVKLCSSNSVKCRKITESYSEVVGGSMMEYIRSVGELNANLFEARKDVLTLRNGDGHAKDIYLNFLMEVVSSMARINSLPIYTRDEVLLCSHEDFGVDKLTEAARMIGNYTIENESYTYFVTLTVRDITSEKSLGKSMESISIQEQIPNGAVLSGDELSSSQEIATTDGANVMVEWNPLEVAEEEYMLMYSFDSTAPPGSVANKYYVPKLTVKGLNLIALEPVNAVFMELYSTTRNYYLSLGIISSLLLVVLFIAYTIITLFVSMLRAKAAGEKAMVGVRKALGRTEIRWKTDLVIAIVLLAAGFGTALFMAPEAPAPESIIDLGPVEFMLVNWWGLVGAACGFIGLLLTYTTIENLLKIMLLERAYGVAIREEKELFHTRADLLMERVKDLSDLVKKASASEFEVGEEYDIVTSIKADKIATISKKMDARNRKIIDDDLAKVEGAIEKLNEKQRLAEENWAKWEEAMDKMLIEQGEVYPTSLVTVPTSLRNWAMSRYAKAHKAQGVSFEGNAIKKKQVSPEKLFASMMTKGLYSGVVVLKNEQVVLAKMGSGSETVQKILAIKLKNYLVSLGKNLGEGEPTSFAAIGTKTVLVYMRDKELDSILFVQKPEFKEAIEAWKANARIIIG
ncbi:MAG: hypothetical protein ABII71_02930 [Candidatus Micrarchaeota archaeon]